jgi:RNA polymerase primary sigma factor
MSMDDEKELTVLKSLIEAGKEKGFLTYDEVNDVLPPGIVQSDQLDDIMVMFGEMDIAIVDEDAKEDAKGAAKDEDGEPVEAAAEGEEGEAPVAVSADSARSNDPVRMYLKRMGSVALLSREGEVEIAKKLKKVKTSFLKS